MTPFAHIIVKGNQLICQHCLGTYNITLPVTVPKLERKGKLFQELHKDCKNKKP